MASGTGRDLLKHLNDIRSAIAEGTTTLPETELEAVIDLVEDETSSDSAERILVWWELAQICKILGFAERASG
jgi:hypothetical protein